MVCAAFDGDTDDAVLAVRDRVVALGVRLPARPPHRPHLTLAAARVEPARLPAVRDLVEAIAAARVPVPVRLAEVGRFGRAGALWLGPGGPGPQPLRDLQRAADGAVGAAGFERAFGARTSGPEWVPHCSLATRLHPARLRAVQAEIRRTYAPIDAVVTGLAVILVGGSGDVGLAELTGAAG